jgi:hypothetical protein
MPEYWRIAGLDRLADIDVGDDLAAAGASALMRSCSARLP